MDALNELKLEQQLRGAANKPPEYQWTQTDLNEAWRKITAPILGLMESLANLPDSVEIVGANQRILPRELTDLATMSPKELLELCGQLREVWTALAALADQQKKLVRRKAQDILQTWWESYPLADGPHWNVYYRTSNNGGSTWSGETVLSSFVSGYNYIFSDGFRFPFGDYFDMDIDNKSHTQVAWGEGYDWLTPGNVWYTRQLR